MIKNKLIEYVNAIVKGKELFDLGELSTNGAFEEFLLNAVVRLKKGIALYNENPIYQNDFLISLRDYLITFETSIALNYELKNIKDFGINRDDITGEYFASLDLPMYLNSKLIEKTFLKSYEKIKIFNFKKEYECLLTDPSIYQLTGYTRFKTSEQKMAVYGGLRTPNGYTTLISLPTGGGKSLVTQTVAYQKEGLTIVVVPTVSLAIDQERSARKKIKRSTVQQEIFYYSSGVNPSEILSAIENKTAKLLFLSPETLMTNDSFKNALEKANKQRYLKNIIIDEAHIVLDWGASFRVDYQCLESWKNNMQFSNPNLRTFLLSATFEERSVELLKNMFSKNGKWIEVRCDSLRKEPRFQYVNCRGKSEKNKRTIELIKKLPHPMIVYVSSPEEAITLKNDLSGIGINNVETFTGETKNSKRLELIHKWVNNDFEIMIATSAFGVGVDKSDVRTVLHLYVPQNANAYYQELGRGGRDGLPSLSCMCLNPQTDIESGRSRLARQVMTADKICDRWLSLYNNPASVRIGNIVHIDTSIVPMYSGENKESNSTHVNWNVYVLLLLRRNNFIEIINVVKAMDKYIFSIKVVDEVLLATKEEMISNITKIHDKESKYFIKGYELLVNAISNANKECWSEMFNKTYQYVDEYCAGCMYKEESSKSKYNKDKLRKSIKAPLSELKQSQLVHFMSSNESAIVLEEELSSLLKRLKNLNVSVLVIDDEEYLLNRSVLQEAEGNMFIININEFVTLMSNQDYFYISGLVAVYYSKTSKTMGSDFAKIKNYTNGKTFIKIYHVFEDNFYLENMNKNITDLIDGPVYRSKSME